MLVLLYILYCVSDSSGSDGEDDDREWYRQEVGEEPDPGEVVM